MVTDERTQTGTGAAARWWTLAVVSAAQLLVVLDGTIVNIALPSAQRALGLTDGNRQWAITAYALAFGGLLLVGGRVGGMLGHRRAFVVGLVGFAAASALGGAAVDAATLFGARALQGAFAAVLAPAGLSLLATAFTRPRERGLAFGVFAAVGAGGAAVGLVAGALLTQYADWRWCLYINVPVALLALLGTRLVPADRPGRARVDVPGALLSVAGVGAVVYGFGRAEALGWGSAEVLGLLVGGVALLAAFVAVEVRASEPLLPMRVLLHRARAGAFLAITLVSVAMYGFYLFMSYYMQGTLGYSPVRTGLVMLVNVGATLVGSTLVAGRLHGRVPPAALVLPGLLVTAAGMLVLTRLEVGGANVLVLFLLPALVLTGLGFGCVMPPTAGLATAELSARDIGVASAAYNAAQQLGAALGVALLNTLAAGSAAVVDGYTNALMVAFVLLVGAAVVVAPLIPRSR
ncbi:MFS transporter [Actinomadura kijaniata]